MVSISGGMVFLVIRVWRDCVVVVFCIGGFGMNRLSWKVGWLGCCIVS